MASRISPDPSLVSIIRKKLNFNSPTRRVLTTAIQLFALLISDDMVVTIKDVSKKIKPAKNPEYVPRKYCKYR